VDNKLPRDGYAWTERAPPVCNTPPALLLPLSCTFTAYCPITFSSTFGARRRQTPAFDARGTCCVQARGAPCGPACSGGDAQCLPRIWWRTRDFCLPHAAAALRYQRSCSICLFCHCVVPGRPSTNTSIRRTLLHTPLHMGARLPRTTPAADGEPKTPRPTTSSYLPPSLRRLGDHGQRISPLTPHGNMDWHCTAFFPSGMGMLHCCYAPTMATIFTSLTSAPLHYFSRDDRLTAWLFDWNHYPHFGLRAGVASVFYRGAITCTFAPHRLPPVCACRAVAVTPGFDHFCCYRHHRLRFLHYEDLAIPPTCLRRRRGAPAFRHYLSRNVGDIAGGVLQRFLHAPYYRNLAPLDAGSASAWRNHILRSTVATGHTNWRGGQTRAGTDKQAVMCLEPSTAVQTCHNTGDNSRTERQGWQTLANATPGHY